MTVHILQAQRTSGVASSTGRSTSDVSAMGNAAPTSALDASGYLSQHDHGSMRYVEPTFWAVSKSHHIHVRPTSHGVLTKHGSCASQSQMSPRSSTISSIVKHATSSSHITSHGT